jgi:catechol 2,3-dioxygenase
MALDPIDFDSFFAGITESEAANASPAAPEGTRLGHMHLRVAGIPTAEEFYQGLLGFDVTARMPGALFLSAGGYHHHLGMNTWESLGGSPPPEPSTGLREFTIVSPTPADRDNLLRRVETAGMPVEPNGASQVILDPFRNRIRLVVAG